MQVNELMAKQITNTNFSVKEFDNELLSFYISTIRKELSLTNNISNDEILELTGIISNKIPTLIGFLIFSKYPQAYFSQLYITAIAVPGTDITDIGSNKERFIDKEIINGSIPKMLEKATNFVIRNSRKKTIIDKNGKRKDKLEYPIVAIQAAILNALKYHDYNSSKCKPIEIIIYHNRIEITNCTPLYEYTSIEELKK